MKTLNIIGAGALGRTVGRMWQQAGVFAIGDVVNRSAASAADAVRFIGGGRPLSEIADMREADAILIATPDGAIAETAAVLARTPLDFAGRIVFHCSGALPSALLAPVEARGALIASVHPIRSFAVPENVISDFAGTFCGVEGNEQALAVLEPGFAALGARLVRIDPDAKTLYHAAAVFAANYPVTLLDIAVQAYGKAGIAPETALQMMAPLAMHAVRNALAAGPKAALSGPAARGDWETLKRQQSALQEWDDELARLYELLGRFSARLAGKTPPETSLEFTT
ncbi:Predicted oxidoreductase, contains short-chain dehydrogenase (SDR) and DUF2520 domains [Noviherbaspirillum humi]|uniref:Predicted oxidoreductase, contains short-chain dehydrogenase (SDR) and DUF2520 domains n=1 Tax=Noviherbaspirillum humi TaxID=1688639 RepID=A0A239H4K3_9BURK|nr:Rossmann-like and DUF2520 domain-containing protein [Noviherbaspirillum humi]SNS76307.1 Predicted oxidoreductase, contains short-chain dehydrogenase (SDR) and DUF2520 domains [Noviherbaspirillum humi]